MGVGIAVCTAAWLALNLAGVAQQLASVGQYFPSGPEEPWVDQSVVPPAADEVSVAVSTSESEPFAPDIPPHSFSRDSARTDYVAAFEVRSAPVRAPSPGFGRLVMDPMMFVFDGNDAELQSVVDELLTHPDEEVRRAASEDLLPAVRR
jgi:hypothetical protein